MKKIIYGLLFASILTLGSCDNLDLAPLDYPGAGDYWKDEAQVETFMLGLHSDLRKDFESPVKLGELRGGTFRDGTSSNGSSLSYSQIITSDLRVSNTGIKNWNEYYGKILQVNMLISKVEKECPFLSDASRSKYLAQAYGIRAYYYFMLYRTYGGVPLEKEVKLTNGKIDLSKLYMVRSSAEETLAFVKEDIEKSVNHFGTAGNLILDRAKWSLYASLFLKAEIYMWSAKVSTNDNQGKGHKASGTEDLTTAKKALKQIINSDQFKLEEKFADVFAYDNKLNKEIILCMPFDRNEITNEYFGAYFLYQPSVFVGSYFDENGNKLEDPLDLCGSGILRYEYKESFVKSFDKTDSRRAATFFEYYSTADEATRKFGSAMIKLIGHAEGGVRYYDSDIIMFRYADVLLRMAECENSLNKPCAEYINQIRKRAYGVNYNSAVAYNEGSYAENELAILKERDKEFVAEGKRWFDVLRMQDENKKSLVFHAKANYAKVYGEDATPVLSENESYKQLWPIDVAVLNGDPELKQTPGYVE